MTLCPCYMNLPAATILLCLIGICSSKNPGMKLILDFVPNHSSDDHLWFLSSKNKTEPYTNFYIWHPGTKDELGKISPPNNMVMFQLMINY